MYPKFSDMLISCCSMHVFRPGLFPLVLKGKSLTAKVSMLLAGFVFADLAASGQQIPTLEMKPEMTEIWEPVIPGVEPGTGCGDAPSDALILFDGSNLQQEWTNTQGGVPGWIVTQNVMTVVKGAGDIKSKRKFSDFQLHIEWRTPEEVSGSSQGRGNSGIFLQDLYEVQVLDSYDNPTYRNGQAASIYKQFPPLVNACRKPGEWQSYDILYKAPVFEDDGVCRVAPQVTVLHNGIVVQLGVSLRGPTRYIGIPEYGIKPHGPGSIRLQDHGNPVSYRNIWIREL